MLAETTAPAEEPPESPPIFDPASLSEVVYASVESAVFEMTAGPSTWNIFSLTNDVIHVYTRNQTLWTGVDLSCVPAASSGILVTPDIVIGAAHNPMGGTIYFVDASNQTYVRNVIVGGIVILDTDLYIARLSEPLQINIIPAKVLPLSAYSGGTVNFTLPAFSHRRVLVAFTNQFRTLRIANMMGLLLNMAVLKATAFESWYSPLISGDSGCACFMIIDGQVVVCGCWYGSNRLDYSNGPSISSYIPQINAAIASLGSVTSLTEIDLSAYSSYQQ